MEILQLSNSFSTGNGGGNFERYVQTVFLLSLLIEGFSPIVNRQVVQLDFQGKHLCYDTDDLIITADGKDKPKVLCQIKHDISVSYKSSLFQEVINSAWRDFQKDVFRPGIDKIALITGIIAKDTISAFRYMYEQALAASDSEDYFTRIKQNNFTAEKTRVKFNILVNALTIANGNIEPSKKQVWEFCKSFVLLIFDLDFRSSINEMLILSLIKCHSAKRAIDVWSGLSRYVGFCNQSAACVHLNNIPEHIKELFNVHEPFQLENNKNVLVKLEPSELWLQLALIGGWCEDYEEDIKIIENITGLTYTDLKPLLCKFSDSAQPYISCQNCIWKVQKRTGILRACEKYFSDQTLERVFLAASEILVQKSNRINQNGEYSFWMVETHEFINSDVLRNNLVRGLCILLNSNLDLSVCSNNICKYFSAKLMQNIFMDCDWVRLASLHDLLSLIAEINPEEYITELETFIETSGTEIVKLFPRDNENPLLARNYIYGIIESIQVLAWDENYLIKCVRCLGEISEKLTNKKHLETVVKAISSILLPWYPQTMASINKQKSAVHALLKETHECGWLVIKALLPGATTVTGETPRPKYISSNIPKELIVSDNIFTELYQYYTSEAVSVANKNVVKLEELTDYIDYFDRVTIETYLTEIASNANQWDDEERFPLWNKLSDFKYKILFFQKGKNSLDTKLYTMLCSTIELIAPQNRFMLYRRLYLSRYDEYMSHDKNNARDLSREKDQKKQEAILDIYNTQGWKAIWEFGELVYDQFNIGYMLGKYITANDMPAIFAATVDTEFSGRFLFSIIKGYTNCHGLQVLVNSGLQDCTTELVVNILSNLNLSQDLLDFVANLPSEYESLFWKQVKIPFAVESQDFDVQYVVYHLLAVGRPIAIVNMYKYLCESFRISSDDMLDILQQAATTESTEDLDSYSAQMMIQSLQEQSGVDINKLSEIELLYLPYLDDFASVHPRALRYRLANDSDFFCDLVQLGYKKRHDDKSSKTESKLSSDWRKRLYQIFQKFCVVPGTDWEGVFHEDIFIDWLNKVKKWSRENDRYEIVMTIVGNGLSYASVDNKGLLCEHILLKMLDASDAREMRKGYYLGIINQRGVHFVDSEGKAEQNLAQKYILASECAEELGYSRYSEALKKISEMFLWEAKQNASAKYPKEEVD